MRKTKHLSRILSLVLAVVLVLGVFVLPAPAKAASEASISGKTKINVRIWVKEVSYGGTDSDIYFYVYFFGGGSQRILMDKSKYNDFEQGDSDTYSITVDRPYYCIKKFGIWIDGSDDMCIQKVDINAYSDGTFIAEVYRNPDGYWIGDGSGMTTEYVITIDQSSGERSQRHLEDDSAYGDFLSTFNTVFYVEDISVAEERAWDYWISDGIYGNKYNPYKYEEPPTYTYKVQVPGSTSGSWVEPDKAFSNLFHDKTKEFTTSSGSQVTPCIGFTYDRQEVWQAMVSAGLFVVKIENTLSYTGKSSPSNSSRTADFYIYRDQFVFDTGEGKVQVEPTYYWAAEDNYFFNQDRWNVVITIPVVEDFQHANYSAYQIVKTLTTDTIDSGADGIRLYYGPGEKDYVVGHVNSSSGNTLRLVFQTNGVSYETISGSSGMKLWMHHVKGDESDWGAWGYTLYQSPRTVTLGGKTFTIGQGDYYGDFYYDLSAFKLDNIPPTIYAWEKGASGDGQFNGGWKQTATLVTSVNREETLYYNGEAKYFDLALLDSNNRMVYFKVKDGDGNWTAMSAHALIPTFTGWETEITLDGAKEYSGLSVQVTGFDFAHNKTVQVYRNAFNLDTKPPEVDMSASVSDEAADGSRNLLIKFNIQEGTGTGVVKYCIVETDPTNPQRPSETAGKETSGTIVDILGQWAFIKQSELMGSTAVVHLDAGAVFNGVVYFYATDAAGNVSAEKCIPVSRQNIPAGCKLNVAGYDHNLPSYDVSFTPDENCVVYYRYSVPKADGTGYTQLTDYVQYDPNGKNPGSAEVTLLSGGTTVLNGTYLLEYKVYNTVSENTTLYEGPLGQLLTFDNSNPEVDISYVDGPWIGSRDTRTFRLEGSDLSGFSSVAYTVTPVGASSPAASGSVPISTSGNTFSAFLSTAEMNLGNGNYKLTVTVTDRNNKTASKTSDAFFIRTAPPALTEITLNSAAAPQEINYLNDSNYRFDVVLTDTFLGTPGNQSMWYRVSNNGGDYSAWQSLGSVNTYSELSGTMIGNGAVGAPVTLQNGMNTIRLQFVIVEHLVDPNGDGVSAPSILSLDPIQIVLDTHAPTAKWRATSGRSRTKLTGTLTVSDDLTEKPTVTAVTPGVTIKARSTKNSYTVTYTLAEGAAVPEKLVLSLTDNAGNASEFTISTELLDIVGPTVAIGTPTYQVYGDRQDAIVTVTVTDDHLGVVNFDQDPAAVDGALISETSAGVYTVRLQGYTGSMPFTVTASDDLGNTTSATSGAISVKYAEIGAPQIVSEPAYAQDSAPAVLRFNIPVAAAATQEEALALAEAMRTSADLSLNTGALLVPGESGAGQQACTIWAADPFGNVASFVLTPQTVFGVDIPVSLTLEQYRDGVKAAGTPSALVAGTHIADPSNPGDSTYAFAARAVVEIGSTEVPIALFPYTILTASDERSGSSGEPSGAKTRIASCDPEDYDDKDTLLTFLAVSPESELDLYGLCLDPFDVSFSRMAFDVERTGDEKQNVSSAELNIGAYLQVERYATDGADVGNPGQTVYIRAPFAATMSFSGTYTITGDTSPYTLETTLGEYDIWMNKSLKLDLPIITAAPEITFSYQQNTIAPEVQFTAEASGCGAAVAVLKLLKHESDGSWTAAAIWTSAEDASAGASIQSVIPEEAAGFYRLYAENEYGLSSLTEAFEITVQSEPIDETDYTLRIFAEVDGRLQEVTGEEPYANTATVRIEFTEEGIDRGLYAEGFENTIEVVLDSDYPNYTFQLADQYGYTLDVNVSYSHFDVTAPTVEYELPDVGKTNQAFFVTITASDDESGLRAVTLTGPSGDIMLDELGGALKGRIAESGSYLITAEDMLGNKTQRTFTVSNIDTTLPTATISRSVPEGVLTLQPVTVYLSFDKPNVIITKVEKAFGEFTQNKAAKTVTFSKNGAATVYFRDDYGNEGYVLVSVSNIYNEPPKVVAIPTLSEDELSVAVRFELERDADGAPLDLVRNLSELTVIYNNVAYRADEAEYNLRTNGTYTFTVVDQVGLMQNITLQVTDIDRSAPKITEVSWTYVYFDSDGVKHNATYNLSTIKGAGYRIAADIYPMTNQNVTVTVTTDAPTSIIGSHGDEWTTDHSLVYHENGMYIYNLEKKNGLSAHFGVDVEIIDKTPPEITLENPEYLMFIENRDKGSFREMLTDYTAIDTYLGVTTDLSDKVVVDFGGLDPDELSNNVFDKSKPYTIKYSVKDAAGNEMVVTRTVVLIGINDVVVTVNGVLPSSGGMAAARDGNVKLELVNFNGLAYVTYAKSVYTFGQMKTIGTLLPRQADGSFQLENLEKGWYTFFVQTELRDYFNIYVYVG